VAGFFQGDDGLAFNEQLGEGFWSNGFQNLTNPFDILFT